MFEVECGVFTRHSHRHLATRSQVGIQELVVIDHVEVITPEENETILQQPFRIPQCTTSPKGPGLSKERQLDSMVLESIEPIS